MKPLAGVVSPKPQPAKRNPGTIMSGAVQPKPTGKPKTPPQILAGKVMPKPSKGLVKKGILATLVTAAAVAIIKLIRDARNNIDKNGNI